MTIDSVAPSGFDDWLESLQQKNIGNSFQLQTASWLRVIAGTKNGAALLVTGTEVIPYADWLQDGMAMNSRLILHNQSKQLTQLVQPHFSADIRVATHAQDFVAFLTDIEEHKFDFVVVDLNEIDLERIATILERTAEHGLLICIGTHTRLKDLVRTCGDGCFYSLIDQSSNSVILSRKGIQHRAVRRGGRRRTGGH